MTRYLHTMLRITDPERSGKFYEALGFEFRKESPIVRDGHHEATNYFYGVPGQDEELELTWNTDGRTYELGTAYGHIAIGVPDARAACDRIRAGGGNVTREAGPVKGGTTVIAFVTDPDGYKIELIERDAL
jgi:lactoylglutathione lyase